MSFVFVSSIAASIAMVWLVTALLDELATLASVAVNILVAAGGASLYLGTQIRLRDGSGLWPALGLALGAWALGAVLFLWARRLPIRDRRPVPRLVQAAFAVFVIVLVGAGTQLVYQTQLFPWRLQPQSATLFGWIFLGAAAYFAYILVRGQWAFLPPPLAGFLVYDLVLYGPYVRMLGGTGANGDAYYGGEIHTTSLVIYLAVLTVSALVSVHALLLSPETRLFGSRTAARAAK